MYSERLGVHVVLSNQGSHTQAAVKGGGRASANINGVYSQHKRIEG